jgi:hypothetical protein
MLETNNNLPSYGLIEVRIALELTAPNTTLDSATAIARSCLVDGRRAIRIGLNASHLIVSRALHRADVVTIRFLVALSLVEFTWFSSVSRDGSSVRRKLKELAGIEPGFNAYGSGFASRLAVSEVMRVIDGLPIFGREPQQGPFELFTFEAPMRSPTDNKGWRQNGLVETPGKVPPKPKAAPAVVAVAAPEPDPFLKAFHATTREALDEATFKTLEELAKGAPVNV